MAKTGAEAAGTSGSQFFVVTGADVGLPPDYAIVGKVVDGLDVVERIGKLGNPAEPRAPRRSKVTVKMGLAGVVGGRRSDPLRRAETDPARRRRRRGPAAGVGRIVT